MMPLYEGSERGLISRSEAPHQRLLVCACSHLVRNQRWPPDSGPAHCTCRAHMTRRRFACVEKCPFVDVAGGRPPSFSWHRHGSRRMPERYKRRDRLLYRHASDSLLQSPEHQVPPVGGEVRASVQYEQALERYSPTLTDGA